MVFGGGVPPGEAGVFANGKGGKLYASYQERLKILNAADFGDLLLHCVMIFQAHPDVLAQWQAADAAAQTDPQAAKASAEASSGS